MRYSVLGLIVLVIGASLGWVARGARIQRQAVEAIIRAGGGVVYDWQWRNHNPVSGGKPPAPRWLVDVLGVDYFGHVAYVVTPGNSDGELFEVEKLSQIQDLVILDPERINDASLVHLKGLTALRSLVLGDARVTDAGISQLTGLRNLEILDLSSTQVTDAGLSHLRGLTRLSLLSLMNTQVTDAGLVHLKPLSNLAELILVHTNVTDDGLAHLKELTNLKSLDVDDTRVTSAGIEQITLALPGLTITR
jgi:Leucine-rich repeat (LRR) protein